MAKSIDKTHRRGKRKDYDLIAHIPKPMISFNDVREGWKALLTANLHIIDTNGTDITDDITNTMIDDTGKEFEEFFGRYKQEKRHMSQLIADAAKVERLPQDSVLYLEGLAVMSITLPLLKDTKYEDMPDNERLKMARFLYRPVNERPLPNYQKLVMLYHHGLDVAPGDVVEGPVEVSDVGLRRLTWNLIESESPSPPPDGILQKLWNERGWDEYFISGRFNPAEVDVVSYNTVGAIETIISDVIDYISTELPGEEKERDLNKIVGGVKQVLPHRQQLSKLGYFGGMYADRHILLQKVFEGEELT